MSKLLYTIYCSMDFYVGRGVKDLTKNKFIVLITILMSLGIFMAGCSTSKDDAVALVNDKPVLKADFDQYLEYRKKLAEASGYVAPDMWDNDAGDGKTFETIIREAVLEDLVLQEVQMQNADNNNIKVDEKEVEESINTYISTPEDKKNFEQYLNSMNLSEEFFKEFILKRSLIINKYIDEVMEVEEQEAKDYYEQRKQLYDSIRASHILVETEEEALDIIKQLNEGADFATLAKEKSTGPSASNGGDLNYFRRGEMLSEFADVAFDLEVGEISGAVKTKYGYHVIKVTDSKIGFDSNKEDVERSIKQSIYNQQIQEEREKANVEILLKFEEPKKSEENNENEATESDENNNEQNSNEQDNNTEENNN